MDPRLFKTKPYDHQAEALSLSENQKFFALFMEQGTGKTKVVIDTVAHLYTEGKIDTLIIIAPKSVYVNWISREIPAHLSNYIDRMAVEWTGKKTKGEKKRLLDLEAFNGLSIFSINIDGVNTDMGLKYLLWLAKRRNCLITVDESTRIKNRKAKRTKKVYEVGNLCPYKRILTGTPVTQSPFDIYSQVEFLSPKILNIASYYAFTHHYAIMDRQIGSSSGRQYRYETVREYRNLDELHERLAPYSYRCLKKDCLDLPPKVYKVVDLHLSGDQRAAYSQMKNELIIEFGDSLVSAKLKLTLVGKLHQIVGGYSKLDDGGVHYYKNNVKLDALTDMAEDLALPCIVWATSPSEIAIIEKALKQDYRVRTFYGATEQDDREDAIDAFQAGEVDFLVMNPQAGGIGITLTRAETVIYYSNRYSYEDRIQSEDRVHRSGLSHSVTYIDLVCQRTIDTSILRCLKKKRSFSDVVTQDPPTTWIGDL